jgi:glucokinase
MIAFCPMKDQTFAFGIDIGGTNTKIGLFSLEGELLAYHSLPTLAQDGAAQFVDQIALDCERLLQETLKVSLGHPSILGAGVGAPMANFDTGMIDHAPNLGWTNVPLKSLFERALKTEAIIENDANLSAFGEKFWGKGKEFKDFILVTLGTGVGTGLVLNHKLYRGHDSLGAEGGHVIIPHAIERACSCGGINHLESFLSARGIKQTMKEMTGEDWKIEKLGQLFSLHNERAVAIIHTIARQLAFGLANMAVLMGPEAFVIGGGVSKLGMPFFEIVEQHLNDIIHFSLKNKIKIVSAELSTDKGAIYGGAAMIFHRELT